MRRRWVTFVGSFVALALGVGLMAATGLALAATFGAPERGPERFAAAPVVVRATDHLRVDTPTGTRGKPLRHPGPVRAPIADRLAALGRTVEDRTFPADVTAPRTGPDAEEPRTGPDARVGHPWPVAAAAPYRLTSG
ncbi:ABC transporter permease, partial [Streptomyces griseus]|nr:ABC transporter permease [Streptomyces griseus]